MAGEMWTQIMQLGREVTEGVAVSASRKIYGEPAQTQLIRERDYNLIKVSTGTRDNQRDIKGRASRSHGTFRQPMSADEIIEWLLLTVKGGVTPTTLPAPTPTVAPTLAAGAGSSNLGAGVYTVGYAWRSATAETIVGPTATVTTTAGQVINVTGIPALPTGVTSAAVYVSSAPGGGVAGLLFSGTTALTTYTVPNAPTGAAPNLAGSAPNRWVFTPGTTLDTATIEYFDGYRPWQLRGAKMATLKIAGADMADNMVDGAFWGRDLSWPTSTPAFAAMTPALPDRVPDFMEGWETRLYIDNLGGTPGTTVVPGTMINWDFTLNNNLGRKYFADNTTSVGAVPLGVIGLQATITLEGNANALTEFTNRETLIKRLVRFEFGNNINIGTTTTKKLVQWDIPGAWTAVDLTPEDNGTKIYKFTYEYLYDVTNAWGTQITVTSGRTTAW